MRNKDASIYKINGIDDDFFVLLKKNSIAHLFRTRKKGHITVAIKTWTDNSVYTWKNVATVRPTILLCTSMHDCTGFLPGVNRCAAKKRSFTEEWNEIEDDFLIENRLHILPRLKHNLPRLKRVKNFQISLNNMGWNSKNS